MSAKVRVEQIVTFLGPADDNSADNPNTATARANKWLRDHPKVKIVGRHFGIATGLRPGPSSSAFVECISIHFIEG